MSALAGLDTGELTLQNRCGLLIDDVVGAGM